MIKIYTDSCSDLGGDIRAEYGIDYIKCATVRGGKETPADLDWPTYTPKELYDIMRGGERITTTQIMRDETVRLFTEEAKAGNIVIYLGCALPLSNSVNTAAVIARDIEKEYPEARFYCINSTNACLGEGLLTVFAAKLRNEGKTAEEIVAAVEEKKNTVRQYVTVGSLDMLKKAGRVKGSAAFFGNLLGVKPIIISDKNGQNVPIVKIKGRRQSLDELVRLTKESVIDAASQTVFIGHADCAEEAEYLRDKLLSEVGFKDAYVNFIGPIIGSSIGPGAIGVFSFGQPVEYAI